MITLHQHFSPHSATSYILVGFFLLHKWMSTKAALLKSYKCPIHNCPIRTSMIKSCLCIFRFSHFETAKQLEYFSDFWSKTIKNKGDYLRLRSEWRSIQSNKKLIGMLLAPTRKQNPFLFFLFYCLLEKGICTENLQIPWENNM